KAVFFPDLIEVSSQQVQQLLCGSWILRLRDDRSENAISKFLSPFDLNDLNGVTSSCRVGSVDPASICFTGSNLAQHVCYLVLKGVSGDIQTLRFNDGLRDSATRYLWVTEHESAFIGDVLDRGEVEIGRAHV